MYLVQPCLRQQLTERKFRDLNIVRISWMKDREAKLLRVQSGSTVKWFCSDTRLLSSSAAGNNVEVDESLFQEIEDLDLDEEDLEFDPLEMGNDED